MSIFLVYLAALLLGALGPVLVGAWVYSRGKGTDARWFAALMFVVAASTLCYALQLIVPGPALTRAVFYARAPLLIAIGPLWLVFALFYTGREDSLTRPVWAVLGVCYGGLLVVVATNEWHGYSYPSLQYVETPFPHLVASYGPAYWAGLIIIYCMMGAALWLIGRLVLRSRHLSRRQAALVLAAGSAGIAVNVGENLNVFPIDGFEYTMVGTALFSTFIGLAIFSHRLFEIQPMARDRIVETIDDPVVVVDHDRRLVDVNAAAEAAFPGVERGIGTSMDEVAPDLISDGGFADTIERFHDGRQHTYSISVTPLVTEQGLAGHALVLKDVTELQSYARELERQAEQLEQVASVISHDLRGPLSVIAGSTALARDGDLEQLERTEAAVERMEDIIERTLRLAREGRRIGDTSPVDLSAIARAAWNTTATDGATLELALPDGIAVQADDSRLQSCFENLFRNAVEHGSTTADSSPSDDGAIELDTGHPDPSDHDSADTAVTVRVGWRSTSDGADGTSDGPSLGAFFVEDDGPGIPAEEREAVSEPGYSTREDGSGLGLAIVSTIARGHGWAVSIEDADLGGARFVIANVRFHHQEEAEGTAGRVRAGELDPRSDPEPESEPDPRSDHGRIVDAEGDRVRGRGRGSNDDSK